MDYFCYISRNKVDQLYNTSSKSDEWTEIKTTENNFGAEAGSNISVANIIDLFKGGITYGRKGVIQREQKVKIHYTEKLHSVLVTIARERPIISLSHAIKNSDFNSIYYHYQGNFNISKESGESGAKEKFTSDSVVSIQSEIETLSHTLILDCSLRFFSEGNLPDGTFLLHSGNSRFFSGGIDLAMETVFIFLSEKNGTIYGTPLFLKLSGNARSAL